ncbi:hypothetical protein QTP88_022005 [Uroleucon formosanum]
MFYLRIKFAINLSQVEIVNSSGMSKNRVSSSKFIFFNSLYFTNVTTIPHYRNYRLLPKPSIHLNILLKLSGFLSENIKPDSSKQIFDENRVLELFVLSRIEILLLLSSVTQERVFSVKRLNLYLFNMGIEEGVVNFVRPPSHPLHQRRIMLAPLAQFWYVSIDSCCKNVPVSHHYEFSKTNRLTPRRVYLHFVHIVTVGYRLGLRYIHEHVCAISDRSDFCEFSAIVKVKHFKLKLLKTERSRQDITLMNDGFITAINTSTW